MEKYDGIRWVLAHAGGFVPYIAQRILLTSLRSEPKWKLAAMAVDRDRAVAPTGSSWTGLRVMRTRTSTVATGSGTRPGWPSSAVPSCVSTAGARSMSSSVRSSARDPAQASHCDRRAAASWWSISPLATAITRS